MNAMMFAGTNPLADLASGFAAEIFCKALNYIQDAGEGISKLMEGAKGDSGASVLNELNTLLISFVSGDLIPVVQGVSYGLVVFFFMVSLIELATQDHLTMETFIKFFSKLAIGIFFVSISDELFSALFEFSEGIANIFAGVSLGKSVNTTNLNVETVKQAFLKGADNSLFGGLILLAYTLVTIVPCLLVGFVLYLISYIISFTRLFELTLRGAFLPIAASLMGEDGWRGAGGRYIKKLIAVLCQSAVLVVIGKISAYAISFAVDKVISGSISADQALSMIDAFGLLGIILGIGIACVSVMFKSIGIINDVFGA